MKSTNTLSESTPVESNPVEPVQVTIHRVSAADIEEVYQRLQRHAPIWLERCDIRSYWELFSWVKSQGSFMATVPSGVIFMSHWDMGLSVRLHPVIWGKQYCLSPSFSRETLKAFHAACYTERVEVVIPVDAPKNLARWAARSGFTCEGLHRKYALWKHRPTDAYLYSLTAAEME